LLNNLKASGLTRKFDFEGSYPYLKMLKDQIKGRNNSWAIRWYGSAFLAEKLTLHPAVSLVQNIGLDGSGTHCFPETKYDTRLDESKRTEFQFPEEVVPSKRGEQAFIGFYQSLKPSFLVRVASKFKRMLHRS
jgi:hypothetical protein